MLMTLTWRSLSRRHHRSQCWAVMCACCPSDLYNSAASALEVSFGHGVKLLHMRPCIMLCTLCNGIQIFSDCLVS